MQLQLACLQHADNVYCSCLHLQPIQNSFHNSQNVAYFAADAFGAGAHVAVVDDVGAAGDENAGAVVDYQLGMLQLSLTYGDFSLVDWDGVDS